MDENTPIRTYSEQEYNALKTQLEESEQALRDFEYRTKIGGYVKSLGLKNDIYEAYVTDLLAENDVKFDGETPIGADKVLDGFREQYPEAFATAEPMPEFSVGMTGEKVKNDDAFVRSVMGIK